MDRLHTLSHNKSKKPYQRQKSSLQQQLESFLWSQTERKSIAIASPQDIVNFLIWRDKFGKSTSHSDECPTRSIAKNAPCSCYRGLAAGTIDNNIGKLRSIFKEIGRGSTWNEDLHIGNPAAHHSVKDYYDMVLEEQTICRRFPKKAVPFFLDKLSLLCTHLRSLMRASGVTPIELYILSRDMAFFSIDFFSGDRASDLGRVKSVDVLAKYDGNSFVFNQVFGKTLRGNNSNVFAIQKVKNSPVCPVANLRIYLALACKLGVDLKTGFLFRSTNRQGNVTTKPFVGTAVGNRLRKHLQDLSISEGETMHGFRSGCSITLSLLGIPYSQISDHVGWKSVDMAVQYSQCEKVMAPDGASTALSKASTPSTESNACAASSLGAIFRDKNCLKGFKPLFS